MSGDFPAADFPGLVDAARDGSTRAARRLVERHERELQAVAYLLTGGAERAQKLATSTLIGYFDRIESVDPDDDPRSHLFTLLADSWLSLTVEAGMPGPGRMALPDSGSGRHRVDDERSRLRDSLALLDPVDRLTLVIADFTGIDPESLPAVTGNEQPAPNLARLRQRVSLAANLDGPAAVVAGLRALAIEAPRAALWESVGPDVGQQFARRRRRARWLTFGVVSVVALAFLALGGLLMVGALRGDEDAGTTAGTAATASPAGTAEPTATRRYTPPGSVPNAILLRPDAASGDAALALYQPATGERFILPGQGRPLISPDGASIVMLEFADDGSQRLERLVAVSSADGAEIWRLEAGDLAAEAGGEVFYDAAAVADRLYIAADVSGAAGGDVSVTAVRLSDGTVLSRWPVNLDAPVGTVVSVDLFGTVESREATLVVLARGAEPAWTVVRVVDLQSGAARTGGAPVPGDILPAGRTLLSPDGRAILSYPANGPAATPSISYLLPDTLAGGEISLPFARSSDDLVLVQYALSHDGRRLYAVAPEQGRVVIIDLERRLVEREFDLDMAVAPRGNPAALDPGVMAESYGGNGAAFSLDGRFLFILGPLGQTPDGGYSPVIWTIDTSTWTVVEERLPDAAGRVAAIHAGAEGRVYLQLATVAGGVSLQVLEGQLAGDLAFAAVGGTLADLYRASYGRSPAVAGTAPENLRAFTTLPRVEVEVEPASGPPGREYALRVRLLDPATGEPVPEDAPELRGAAPDSVTATFRNGGQQRVAVLGPSGSGIYSGRLALDLPGGWDLELSAGAPSGDGWRVIRPAAVDIVDTVTDSAGREYVLEVATDPAPISGELVEMTVTFEHINSGLILPSSEIPSEAELSEALPESLALVLPDGETITLYRASSIAYTGHVRFPDPGVNFPTIRYQNDLGREVLVTLRIEVMP